MIKSVKPTASFWGGGAGDEPIPGQGGGNNTPDPNDAPLSDFAVFKPVIIWQKIQNES